MIIHIGEMEKFEPIFLYHIINKVPDASKRKKRKKNEFAHTLKFHEVNNLYVMNHEIRTQIKQKKRGSNEFTLFMHQLPTNFFFFFFLFFDKTICVSVFTSF